MRTIRILVVSCLVFASSAVFANELEEYNQIRRASALFVVQAFNPTLFQLTDMYAEISDEYKSATNEFEKKKIENKYDAETQKLISELRRINKFYVNVPIALSEYDFKKKGFPVTTLMLKLRRPSSKDDGIFFDYGSDRIGSVTVDIDNFKKDIFISMPMEKAERLAPKLNESRDANLIVYGTVSNVKKEPGLFENTIHVHMWASKTVLKLESDEVIGSHAF